MKEIRGLFLCVFRQVSVRSVLLFVNDILGMTDE